MNTQSQTTTLPNNTDDSNNTESQVHITRQPIMNAKEEVVSYQLLARSSKNNQLEETDHDLASVQLLQHVINVMGSQTLAKGQQLFLTLTPALIQEDLHSVLAPSQVVITPGGNNTADNIKACQTLKSNGYKTTAQIKPCDPMLNELIKTVDYAIVNFKEHVIEEIATLIQMMDQSSITWVAQSVETPGQFKRVQEAGFELFLGNFFMQPRVVTGQDAPVFKQSQLKLLKEVNQPELAFEALDRIIKRDPALAIKLLRYINAAAWGLREKITSIKHALVLLGEIQVRKWLSLITMTNLCENKPKEIAKYCIVRSQFCESVGQLLGQKEHLMDFYMTGLFSMLDKLLDRPLPMLLSELPVSDTVKEALKEGENDCSKALELVAAYEQAEWTLMGKNTYELGLDMNEVSQKYYDACQIADEIMDAA